MFMCSQSTNFIWSSSAMPKPGTASFCKGKLYISVNQTAMEYNGALFSI